MEEMISVYGERLLRYATSILYNHQDAEDVVQDVFIAAYQNKDSLSFSLSLDEKSLSAWLYKATYNKSINKLRRRRFLVFGDMPENTVAPDNTGFSDEMLYALGALAPRDRALLYARIVEGYDYEELSLLMGCSQASLRKRYERAKKRAAKLLSPNKIEKGVLTHGQRH